MRTLFLLLCSLASLAPLWAQQPASRIEYIYPTETAPAPLNAKVLVRFCCGLATLQVSGPQGLVPGQTTSQDRWAVFTPSSPWAPLTKYTVTLAIASLGSSTATFTTGTTQETGPFRIQSTVPADGEDGILMGPPIRIRFSHPVNPLTSTAVPIINGQQSCCLRWSWDSAFELSTEFDGLQLMNYQVAFEDPRLEDTFGRRLENSSFRFRFSTHPDPPTTGPLLQRSVPDADENNVPTNTAITLEFNHPVFYGNGALSLAAAGESIPLELDSSFSTPSVIVLRPQRSLRANQDYTLSANGLTDVYGRSLTATSLLRFRTGAVPETGRLTILAEPAKTLPQVSQLLWRFSRPVHPLLLPQLRHTFATSDAITLPLRVSDDGLTVTANIPGHGAYVVNASFRDRALSTLTPSGNVPYTFLVGKVADTQPPRVIAVQPAEGTVAAPNLPITILFDDNVVQSDVVLQVTANQQPVAFDQVTQFITTQLVFRPRQPLVSGTSYRAELSGIRDAAGNIAPNLIWNFTVESPSAEPFRLLSFAPANGTLEFPKHGQFTATFNRPPSLLSVYQRGSRFYTDTDYLPGDWQLDQNTLSFQPSVDMPPGKIGWQLAGITDNAGQAVATTPELTGFAWVGGGHPDAGSGPRLVSVSPSPDAPPTPSDNIVLEFDQPLEQTIVATEAVQVELDGRRLTEAQFDANTSRNLLIIHLSSLLQNTRRIVNLRIFVTGNLLGLNKVAAQPALVTLAYLGMSTEMPRVANAQPLLRRQPNLGASIFPDAPLVLYFNRPMDPAVTERHVQVVVERKLVKGRWVWTADNRSATVYMEPEFPIGTGYILFPASPLGLQSSEIYRLRFEVRPRQPEIQLFSNSARVEIPNDGVMDLYFSQDQPDGYLQSALLDDGGFPRRQIPLNLERLSPRVVRLRTQDPLPEKLYALYVVKTGQNPTYLSNVTVLPEKTSLSRQVYFGPTEDYGDVPANVLICVNAATWLNPVGIQATIRGGGESRAFTTQVLASRLVLRPVGLLRSHTTYTVSISSWQDATGQPMPPLTWTFRTGDGVDLEPPQPTSFTPRITAEPDAIPTITFDRPMAVPGRFSPNETRPISMNDFGYSVTAQSIPGKYRISPNGRTVSMVPNQPWPAHETYRVDTFRIWGLTSWTGEEPLDLRDNPWEFRIGGGTTNPPFIEAVSPPRNSTNAVRNSIIRLRFAQEIRVDSLNGVNLQIDGKFVPVQRELSADGRILNLVPRTLLAGDSTYTVIVQGVKNIAGQTQPSAESWDIRTGNSVAASLLMLFPQVKTENGLSFTITASRPIDPVEFASRRFSLQLRNYVAVDAKLSEDGYTIRVTPREPIAGLPAGDSANGTPLSGTLYIPALRDWAGQRTFPTNISTDLNQTTAFPFNLANPQPSRTPELQSVLPMDGTTVGTGVMAAAVFDQPVFAGKDASLRVTSNGREVAARLTFNNQIVFVVPPFTSAPWLPGQAYTIAIDGLANAVGQPAPPATWSFQIRADGSPEPDEILLESMVPARGAVGVPTNTPITFNFSAPVMPIERSIANPQNVIAVQQPNGFRINIPSSTAWRGPRVEFIPTQPLPGGVNVAALLYTQLLNGRSVTFNNLFTTAATPDATPPELESVFPASGTRLAVGVSNFVLRFSKPIRLPLGAVSVSPSEAFTVPEPFLAADGQTLTFRLVVSRGGGTFTVNLSNSITDLAGNSFRGLTMQYPTFTEEESAVPRLVSMLPAANSVNVPREATVLLRFTQPMNEASLGAGITLTEDGSPRPVTLTNEGEGRLWRLTPAAPFARGAVVTVKVAGTLYSETGTLLFNDRGFPITQWFRVEGEPATPTLTGLEATTAFVDLRFSERLDAPPAEPFGLRNGQQRVPARIEQMGDSWWRLTPDQPLRGEEKYHLMAGPGVEFPLAAMPTSGPTSRTSLTSEPTVTEVTPGEYLLRWAGGSANRNLLHSSQLFDAAGEPLAGEVLVSANGGSLLFRCFTATKPASVRIGGRFLGNRFAIGKVTPEPKH